MFWCAKGWEIEAVKTQLKIAIGRVDGALQRLDGTLGAHSLREMMWERRLMKLEKHLGLTWMPDRSIRLEEGYIAEGPVKVGRKAKSKPRS